jgi:hypothetical protein
MALQSTLSHKPTHATGGSDALTPADIGASATGHTHSGADIEFTTQDAGTINEWTPVDANEVAGRANNAFHSVNSVGADVANHISNFSNPHGVTAAQIGAEPTITTLPISKGGTGSTTAADALTALGAEPVFTTSYVSNPTADTLLTAGRRRIVGLVSTGLYNGGVAKVWLPEDGNLNGDIVRFQSRFITPGSFEIYTGIFQGTPADLSQGRMFKVGTLTKNTDSLTLRFEGNWTVVPVGLHTHSVADITGAARTSAENTFSAPQVISGDSDSTMLRVTQIGGGEAFRVEDESPDSTPFVISNTGRVGIGVGPDENVGLSVNSSGIKFSDGSIQSSSATGIKTVLAQTTENVSGSVSGNDFLVTGTATLVVDGYTPPVGGIVVFASQANPVQNGFWRVKVNNGSSQPILERPTWFGSTTTNVSPLVYITRYGATQWGFVMALTGPLGNSIIVVGATALTAHRISGRAPTVGIVAIPSASNSAGTVGQIAVDDANNFLYVCTSANVWKRTALTTF